MPKCPLQPEYVFATKCCIESCQHHTKVTACNCMALDRRTGEHILSVAEIGFYKEYALSNNLSAKGVEAAVRRRMAAIREGIRLYTYICYLDEIVVSRPPHVLTDFQQLLFKELSTMIPEIRNWMIPYLSNLAVLKDFAATRKGLEAAHFNFRLLVKNPVLINLLKQKEGL